MVSQIAVLGVSLGSTGVADGSPYDARKAAEGRLGSPEAPESKHSSPQRLLVRRRWRLRDPTGEPRRRGPVGRGNGEDEEKAQQEAEICHEQLQFDLDREPNGRFSNLLELFWFDRFRCGIIYLSWRWEKNKMHIHTCIFKLFN